MMQEVGSSAFGSWVIWAWGCFRRPEGWRGPALPEDGGLAVPYVRFIWCRLEPSLAVCPRVKLPYPAMTGMQWGHRCELEQHECAGWECGDQDPEDLGAAPLGHRGNLAEPQALWQAGWGRDKGISAE